MLFAGDQKTEHLNDDFYGPRIDPQDADPEHLFRIAAQARVGVFATQLGLIARYGSDYRDVPYLVKLNSKSNLIKTSQADPRSSQWLDLQQVIDFQESSGLDILGVGYTIYRAIGQRDFPVVLGGVTVILIAVMLVNLIVDVSYAFLDPRIRYGGGTR
jgi:DhnA family fructose-bisphosphate aldolase class Ia